jgi:UDP-glucose 4-epimerase
LESGKTILITGGCGYIGSHTALDLLEKGFDVVSIDNLSRSKQFVPERIKSISGKNFTNYRVDLRDLPKLRTIIHSHPNIAGIIHFAAFKSVGESVQKPLIYFDNNVNSTINILRIAEEYEIPNFVFSSSCSVYGNTNVLPVSENTPLSTPESPYGWTKLVSEEMIAAHAKTSKIKFIALRYFNPVGAHDSGQIGEIPFAEPENLVPSITQSAIGKKGGLIIHGNDYPTRDGSCVRDFVHVMDIAEAHSNALLFQINNLQENNFEVFNLGSGNGVTVLELINSFERVSNTKLNYTIGARREGDVVAIYADNQKAKNILSWETKRNLDNMMESAWKWEQQLQNEQI